MPKIYIPEEAARQVADAIASSDPLPGALRARLETFFGESLGDVRLSVSDSPLALGADAFAFASTIVIRPGRFQPDTQAGIALLAHETAHVLQQRGCSRPQSGPLCLLRDSALERDAEDAARAYLERRAWRASTRARGLAGGTPAVQLQATGNLDTHYLDGGTMNPPGGAITFAANNSMNEVWTTRAQAFARAKSLLGIANSVAKRTYHFWLNGGAIVAALNEGIQIAGNGNAPMLGAAAGQRTGRYYDFGRGKLIVEHPEDPNSWTAVGAGAHTQRGHFHCCQYTIGSGTVQSMYMLYATNAGFSQTAAGPAVYDWDRRFSFETAAGGVTGHHIYYH